VKEALKVRPVAAGEVLEVEEETTAFAEVADGATAAATEEVFTGAGEVAGVVAGAGAFVDVAGADELVDSRH
jgi:hypothetical protein